MICPVCRNDSFSEWSTASPFGVVTCDSCGLGITSPFPTAEEISVANQEIYQVEKRIATYLARQTYFEKRYRRYLETIRKLHPGGRLLDVGCNIGLFLKVARECDYDVTGVELNKECAEYGQTHFGLKIFSDYIENVGFADSSFDVITLFDVLEHVPDPNKFMWEISKILKNDGIVVLQMPNLNSLMASICTSKWQWLTPPDHLYHFTPKSIRQFLENSGFKMQMFRTWEPVDEFCNNVLTTYKSKRMLGKFFFKFNQLTKLITMITCLMQRLWWKREKGGLLEIYASKTIAKTQND